MGDPAGDQEPARVLQRRRELPLGLSRSFLIVHGLEGSGPEHWQSWLAGRLREHGEDVRYPDLPEPFDPEPSDWVAALRAELAQMRGERVVLCHSLGSLTWMLLARESGSRLAERVLLVAPPCDMSVPAVARFWPDGIDRPALEAAAGETLVLWSEPDPYCPAGAPAAFGDVFPRSVRIPDRGHLNADAGLGPWPEVERWALSGRAPS